MRIFENADLRSVVCAHCDARSKARVFALLADARAIACNAAFERWREHTNSFTERLATLIVRRAITAGMMAHDDT